MRRRSGALLALISWLLVLASLAMPPACAAACAGASVAHHACCCGSTLADRCCRGLNVHSSCHPGDVAKVWLQFQGSERLVDRMDFSTSSVEPLPLLSLASFRPHLPPRSRDPGRWHHVPVRHLALPPPPASSAEKAAA